MKTTCMKTCLYLAFAFGLSSCGSVSSQSELTISQAFSPAKTYKFEIRRGGKKDPKDPSSGIEFVTTYATATAKKDSNDLNSITFTYGESKIEGTSAPADVVEKYKDQELYYGVSIVFQVDKEGTFVGLTNYEDLKKQLQNAMIKMYQQRSSYTDKAVFNQITAQLLPTYDTEEKLIDTYFPELSAYFKALGNHYTMGKSSSIHFKSTNPFGGEAFPITAKTTLNKIENHIATIHSTGSVNRNDLNRIMTATFQKLAESRGQTFDKSQLPRFDITVTREMKYDVEARKLISVVTSKRINAAGAEQESITEIRLVN